MKFTLPFSTRVALGGRQDLCGVTIEPFIGSDDRQIVIQRLADEHAIERISMVHR
jgi:hypothetical protein